MKHFYLTAVALLASGLSAITAQANTMPSAANVFGQKLVSQISDGTNVSTLSYNESNQLISVSNNAPYSRSGAKFYYESGVYNGEPYDMRVEITDPGENIVCYITLNDSGYAAKSVEIETEYGEAAEYETYTFEYDDDGHLIKITEAGVFYNETITFDYDNGDIRLAAKRDKDVETYTVNYTSSTVTTPIKNVGMVMDFDAFGFDNFENTYFYYAGILGRPTEHLPISVVEIDKGEIDSTRFDWTFNTEGYPIQYKEYENNKLEDIFNFSWMDIAALMSIEIDEGQAEVTDYYDISGRRHAIPLNGLNIRRHADGTASKVILR